MKQEASTFYPENKQQWRDWLQENHDKEQSVWVTGYRIDTGKPGVSWSDLVDEALCFGWIDSTRKTIGEGQYIQFFTRRKPKSTWSKINKAKIEKLVAEKKMTKAGLKVIEVAKANGSWNILDEVEELIIPEDLEKEFKLHPGSKEFFLGLSKSVRKMALHRIVMAKREETRQKRITEIAEALGKGLKPQ